MRNRVANSLHLELHTHCTSMMHTCTHTPTRGYVPVCPDGAPHLPSCPVVSIIFRKTSPRGQPNFTHPRWFTHLRSEVLHNQASVLQRAPRWVGSRLHQAPPCTMDVPMVPQSPRPTESNRENIDDAGDPADPAPLLTRWQKFQVQQCLQAGVKLSKDGRSVFTYSNSERGPKLSPVIRDGSTLCRSGLHHKWGGRVIRWKWGMTSHD
eukprot:1910026-Prymnesium_polylepis.1